MNKTSVLLLSPEAPYPVAGGGALRTASLVEYLGPRTELDVVVFREPGSPDPAAAFPTGLTRHIHVIELPAHSRRMPARVFRNLRRLAKGSPPLNDRFAGFGAPIAAALDGSRYDIAIIEHFWCATYVDLLRERAPVVGLDLHNIESILFDRSATGANAPMAAAYRRFGELCRQMEQRLLPKFSFLMTASPEDAEVVKTIAADAKAIVYANAIPLRPRPSTPKENIIAFTGNLEYHPNSAAVFYFFSEIWPLIARRHPGLKWRIIGRNPDAVRHFVEHDPRVELTGPVDDAVELLASAKVAVAPLRAGSGTRVKILEAWAAGVPVVSTSIGAEGLGARHGEHLLISDTAEDFAECVCSLLNSEETAEKLAQASRVLYENEFIWEAAWNRLDRVKFLEMRAVNNLSY